MKPDIAARRGPRTVEILKLRIELQHVQPTVSRTVLLRASSSLSTLHRLVQAAMGWQNSHLHEFVHDGLRYGPDQMQDWDLQDDPLHSERKQLGTLFRDGSPSLRYLYDFGDGWEHTITLLERLPADPLLRKPKCIDGENACPPEDVGGPPGYMYYLEAVLDVTHEEHQQMIDWRGPGFDPRRFDLEHAEAEIERCV